MQIVRAVQKAMHRKVMRGKKVRKMTGRKN